MKLPITPCLWFNREAEAAANHYVSIFDNARVTGVSHYPDTGQETHGMPAGTVLTVEFELRGQPFTALNGGPLFKFNEAASLQVFCETQEELDHYWQRLGEGGDPAAQQCGWLKDRYGLSWQITPSMLLAMMKDPDAARVKRVMAAFMPMKKLDIEALKRAYAQH